MDCKTLILRILHMFLHPLYNSFGLDIGDLSLKAVQLKNLSYIRRTPSYAITAYRSVALPPGLVVNGELVRPEEIRKHLLNLLGRGEQKKSPLKGHWVVASIPESQSAIKLVTTDKSQEQISPEEIRALAKKHIPFDDGAYYLDWQWVPKTDKECCSLLLCATPKTISDSYTYLLESLGLGVIALEIESVAIARAMVTAGKSYEDEARIILDVGATGTSAIVYDNGTVQFSTSLPFSGELLTTALEQKTGSSHEAAEAEKKKQGISYQKGPAWAIVSQYVDELAAGIKKTIDFYYSHFKYYHPVTRITMSGGGAITIGLSEALTEKIGIESKPGNPWKNISQKKSESEKDGLAYATAIGLALYAADNPLLTRDSV